MRPNEKLIATGRPPIQEAVTFHALRRTYAALRPELGEHPTTTAAQMGHWDPRMTLRATPTSPAWKPQTKRGGLLGDTDWALSGTGDPNDPDSTEAANPRRGRRTAATRGSFV